MRLCLSCRFRAWDLRKLKRCRGSLVPFRSATAEQFHNAVALPFILALRISNVLLLPYFTRIYRRCQTTRCCRFSRVSSALAAAERFDYAEVPLFHPAYEYISSRCAFIATPPARLPSSMEAMHCGILQSAGMLTVHDSTERHYWHRNIKLCMQNELILFVIYKSILFSPEPGPSCLSTRKDVLSSRSSRRCRF